MNGGPLRSGLVALTLCALPALDVGAAEWVRHSSAQVYAQMETNPRMLVEGARDEQSGVLDASLALQRRTELQDISLNGGAQVFRYHQDPTLDRDIQSMDLSWRRRGERTQLIGTLSATRDTTLSSELGSTGFTQFNLRHFEFSAMLSPTWQISERGVAGVIVSRQESRYQNERQSGLVDYSYEVAGFNGTYTMSERSELGLRASYGRLQGEGFGFDTQNLEARLEYTREWSNRWSTVLSGGPAQVITADRHVNGSVYALSINRKAERFTLGGSLQRRIVPSGRGFLSRRDDVGFNVSAQLSEHVDGSLGLSYVRSRDYIPSFGFTFSEVRYFNSNLSVFWRFAEDWSLGLSASSAEQKQVLTDSTGRGFQARLQLAWRRVSPIS